MLHYVFYLPALLFKTHQASFSPCVIAEKCQRTRQNCKKFFKICSRIWVWNNDFSDNSIFYDFPRTMGFFLISRGVTVHLRDWNVDDTAFEFGRIDKCDCKRDPSSFIQPESPSDCPRLGGTSRGSKHQNHSTQAKNHRRFGAKIAVSKSNSLKTFFWLIY